MDDTQDKVRRNLVAFSSLIVLVQFLNVELNPNATIWFFSLNGVGETKFWFSLLVVLIYLYQRYWFDDVTAKQRLEAWQTFKAWRDINITSILRKEAEKVINGTQRSRLITSIDAVGRNEAEGQNDKIRLYTTTGTWRLNGECNGHFERIELGEPRNMGHIQVRYALNMLDVLTVSFLPAMRSVVFAKGLVDFLVPMGLFLLALCICLWRIKVGF